jgi:hypothetical protein
MAKKADALLSAGSIEKLEALVIARDLVLVKVELDGKKVAAAYKAYADTTSAKQAIIEKSFKNVVFGDAKGIEAYKLAKEDEVQKLVEADIKATKESTLALAKEIKETIKSLPTIAEFKKGLYTADQAKAMKALVIADGKKASKIDQLVDAYEKLGYGTAETEAEKIALLVKGHVIAGNNPATEEVETSYLDTKIGNFAGEGEKALLETAFALPAAYDEAEAFKVIELVSALPLEKLIEVEHEAQVAAAKKAYKALSDDQMKIADNYVGTTYCSGTIDLAKKAIAIKKQQARTLPVELAISEIGALASLTLEGKDKVAAAEKAYKALSAEDKAVIDALPAKGVLTAAVAKIAQLETEIVLESDSYKAAVKAFADDVAFAELVVVNKDTKAAADALVAAYEAMAANEKAYFANNYEAYQSLVDQLVSALEVYNLYA